MRIGKPGKKSRSSAKAGDVNVRGVKSRLKNISKETVIGQVSPDLIETIFAPQVLQLASQALEQYATASLLYDEEISEFISRNESVEAEIGVDGSISTPTAHHDRPIPPKHPLFDSQFRIEELQTLLSDTSQHFMSKTYKVHIKAAKFERLLDEKYGIFRPFIKEHPEIEQFLRSMHRKYVSGYFHPLRQSPPPIPRSTSVILLFMLYRGKVPFGVVVLAALFLLVGLQPWALVAIITVLRAILHRRKNRAIGAMKSPIPAVPPYYDKCQNDVKAKHDILCKPVGNPLCDDETIDGDNYDVIMIGHGPGTLFAASLLSRAGRKVLVLSPETDASGCLQFQTMPSSIEGSDNNHNSSSATTSELMQQLTQLTFDVENNNIPKISVQQELLALALSTTNDCLGGIRFAKIGSSMDDYAFEILSVPGMGRHHDDVSFESSTNSSGGDIPFILKGSGGVQSLVNDAADYLGDQYPELENNESSTFRYVTNCEAINAKAAHFFLSKILDETSWAKFRGGTPYTDSTLHNTAEYLNQNFALNPHLRSLLAAIGMKGENLSPSSTCLAAHISNVCNATNEEGMHYPIGGPRAICHAFANIIEQNGRIITNAPITELVFDKDIPVRKKSRRDKEPSPPYCVGVKLRTGAEIRFSSNRYKQQPPNCPTVVSMVGFIQTFIRHLADDIRSEFKVPRGIPALSERRPVVHVLFALKGSAADLNLTGADFYRLPGAALPHDCVDPVTGKIQYGDIGWVDEDQVATDSQAHGAEENAVTSDTEKTEPAATRRRKKKKHVKFEAGQSWIRISFPSAKDPSFSARHGDITTCVVTIEADDEFVLQYETKPKFFMRKKPTASTPGEIQRLCDRVKRDLFDIYPQLSGTFYNIGSFAVSLTYNISWT
jgi:hypothetical protein